MTIRTLLSFALITSAFAAHALADGTVTPSEPVYTTGEGTYYLCECTSGDSAQVGDLMQLWLKGDEISFRQYFMGSDPESGELRRADVQPKWKRLGMISFTARNIEGDEDVTHLVVQRALWQGAAEGSVFVDAKADYSGNISHDRYECSRK